MRFLNIRKWRKPGIETFIARQWPERFGPLTSHVVGLEIGRFVVIFYSFDGGKYRFHIGDIDDWGRKLAREGCRND